MAAAWEPNFVRVQPSRYGPISSVGWEARREGIEDYRYLRRIDTLSAAMPGARAEEARAWLDRLRKRVVETTIDAKPDHPWDKFDLWTQCPQFEAGAFALIREQAVGFLLDLEGHVAVQR